MKILEMAEEWVPKGQNGRFAAPWLHMLVDCSVDWRFWSVFFGISKTWERYMGVVHLENKHARLLVGFRASFTYARNTARSPLNTACSPLNAAEAVFMGPEKQLWSHNANETSQDIHAIFVIRGKKA